MSRREDTAAIVRSVLHELRSRVGAVRLAVNAIQDAGADRDARASMLETADRETLRISTEMSAVSALVDCLTDTSRMERVDVILALRRAATMARRKGVEVRVRSSGPSLARARASALGAGLQAAIQLVADAGGEVIASASRDGTGVLVRIERSDGRRGAAGPTLIRSLVEGMGAGLVPSDDGLEFRLPGARK